MTTPIYDFVRRYAASDTLRLHMPGHKGRLSPLGCEAFDLTEISGAGALYESGGIIAESEQNAASLFGSGRTLYSTEGSSQCIRAMVYLTLLARPEKAPPVIVAARNAHKAFIHAAALCDAEIVWLWPEKRDSLCACRITPEGLEGTLKLLSAPPAAVYTTSPDYLGNMADVAGLAAVCKQYGVPLLVDNAHGAYLKFLPESRHPLDLGTALCCDSAHKTLPALTGGAYLHISKDAPAAFAAHAKQAMALFGSTSPSYLTLSSLDLCNQTLSENDPTRLSETIRRMEAAKAALRENGWQVGQSDPLRLTLRGDGFGIAARLRKGGVEPEYADRDFCVLMATPENPPGALEYIAAVLGRNDLPAPAPVSLPLGRCETVCTPREALFAPQETVPAAEALGRVCGAPTVSCPPAVPVAVSGERIGTEALTLFDYYGIQKISVLR